MASDQALSLEVDVLASVVEVALVIFELLLEVRLECRLKVVLQYLLVKPEGMLNLSDILEMHGVRYLQALHAIRMPPLLEVFLESTASPVAGAAAYLALELHAQPMQLVQPVGYRFPVPPHGQVLGVVLGSLIVIVGASTIGPAMESRRLLGFKVVHLVVRLQLVVMLRLLLPHEVLRIQEHVLKEVVLQFQDPCLQASDVLQPRHLCFCELTSLRCFLLLYLLNPSFLAQLIDSFDVRATLLVMLEHILIGVGFVACDAMKRVSVVVLVRSPSYFQNSLFPTEKTALFPLGLEHFICLLLNLVPRDQRLSLLKEMDKVILDVLQVSLVF